MQLASQLVLALAANLALAQLHPLVQIWSPMAPENQDGDSQNANSRLQNGSPPIIYTVYGLKTRR